MYTIGASHTPPVSTVSNGTRVTILLVQSQITDSTKAKEFAFIRVARGPIVMAKDAHMAHTSFTNQNWKIFIQDILFLFWQPTVHTLLYLMWLHLTVR